ncbi:bifunctional 4-hydroxy-2-oxoglutarate aldolase/2-dehydro-3-deoxy-phosphogluconate aldolase [Nesterenkonia ebinurensis]|uniref:bifunctional 4-hydroxy-2-oxoglutarate aldolase/2-dehydro-3-deoxy-phosphogluconate aldolase n=1 Tax=Nesterenkonia ebinurensis TaxID=2608252 RepID=UPI00123E20BC|nr:bifunctional 4-hydroxy-2-oxoglutarate aldolase/2-dehydro-3-deoxy-phosphogluconate aldolase [Nesterenkonia ebinurensis]
MSPLVDNAWFDTAFAKTPVMAILRGLGVERSLELAATAWDLGIDSVELPLQNDEDAEAIRQVVTLGASRGKSVGAGTIIYPEEIDIAKEVGASYLVSPGLDRDLVLQAYDTGMPFLPGIATPSELQTAQALGLTWVKAFPARWLSPEWFSLMRGPFPDVKFVATGGLNGRNAQSFLDVGVSVVAVGSALEDSAQLQLLGTLI